MSINSQCSINTCSGIRSRSLRYYRDSKKLTFGSGIKVAITIAMFNSELLHSALRVST